MPLADEQQGAGAGGIAEQVGEIHKAVPVGQAAPDAGLIGDRGDLPAPLDGEGGLHHPHVLAQAGIAVEEAPAPGPQLCLRPLVQLPGAAAGQGPLYDLLPVQKPGLPHLEVQQLIALPGAVGPDVVEHAVNGLPGRGLGGEAPGAVHQEKGLRRGEGLGHGADGLVCQPGVCPVGAGAVQKLPPPPAGGLLRHLADDPGLGLLVQGTGLPLAPHHPQAHPQQHRQYGGEQEEIISALHLLCTLSQVFSRDTPPRYGNRIHAES